jgi:hypothetical protein
LEARLSPTALDPWEAWKVFKRFLEIPVEDVYDAASFQYSTSDVEGEASMFGTFVVESQPQFQDMCNCAPRRTDVWSEEL